MDRADSEPDTERAVDAPEAALTDVGLVAGDRLVVQRMCWVDRLPSLQVRRNGASHELISLGGLQLRYSLAPARGAARQRRCVGHKPFRGGEWFDCDNAAIEGSITCDRCAANDATFASQLHHAHTRGIGEIDPAVRAHLDQPNVAYLAAFRDGSVKIGTSTERRLDTRLLEQGAWLATVVAATTDGVSVRSLEDQITSEVGLPQSVSMGRKLSGLVAPRPDEDLRRELGRWTAAIHGLIGRSGNPSWAPAEEEWAAPGAGDSRWERVHRYSNRLDTGAHDIEFHTATGRAAIVTRPGGLDQFVVDVRQLAGVELVVTDDVVADELAVQDSLF